MEQPISKKIDVNSMMQYVYGKRTCPSSSSLSKSGT